MVNFRPWHLYHLATDRTIEGAAMPRLQIETLYIAPGGPREYGCAESFHSKLGDEFLNRETFENVSAARKQTVARKEDYNHDRPHRSLE